MIANVAESVQGTSPQILKNQDKLKYLYNDNNQMNEN